ncbi:hypothetical protein [Enterococcus caccae]|uniref:Uncharacterized protein n=1 Tax=Enterococcus caccae ATCC BAA-1240 TaxID=1158612 RepID=R3W6Z9_9ENTE|nr:hypothetical protein [Enterococcus caccae]EOL43342.1 hypothetical protein UC7_02671 [Enterococcus caccae ATCC BAA-1240]EOT68258.1 hypothetical protein I580_00641 [Enterococcus caccae ATCC BAA-1240]
MVYGVLLIAVFGLTACENDKKTAISKVEELKSRVKDLESSSSEETQSSKINKDKIFAEEQSELNKIIVSDFLDNNLIM